MTAGPERTKGKATPRWLWPLTGAGVFLFMLLGTGYFAAAGVVVSLSLETERRALDTRPGIFFIATAQTFQAANGGPALSGWLLFSAGGQTRERVIVLVHGLGDHRWTPGHRELTRAYIDAGFTVFAYDSRGQGESGGAQLRLGWGERDDVRGAVDLLLAEGYQPGRIGIHGTSYGAATALLAAAAIPEIGAVVADSAFADLRDVMTAEIAERTGLSVSFARLLGPGIALVTRTGYGLNLAKIPPVLAVPKIAAPILFIHGGDDARVPVAHAEAFMAASANPADELWILPGMGHTEGIWLDEGDGDDPSPFQAEYLDRVTAFFDRNLP